MGNRRCASTLEPEMSEEELAALDSWIGSRPLTGPHLEVGTAAGGTLCFLMTRYQEESRPRFVVVDTMAYFDRQFETVRRNLTEHGLDPRKVDFRVRSSSTAYEEAATGGDTFEFVLVDASHKIRHVMNDLRWLKLMRRGGLACFHDYGSKFPGVTWPLDRFLRRNPHFERIGQAGSLLGVRKVGERKGAEVTYIDHLWALVNSPLLQWERSLRKRFGKS